MGKKVNPYSFRLGLSTNWKSRWYSKGFEYVKHLNEDLRIKQLIQKKLSDAGISKIEIERFSEQIKVTIFTSRPGVVIGRQGSALEELKAKIKVLIQSKDIDIVVDEIRKPEIVSAIVASSIARQIEKRIPYRRCCKQAIIKAMESKVKGCKIRVSGRLNGAEIARSETFSEGRIPLQTIRADIDYAGDAANTTYGKIGVKVWIYKGDLFQDRKQLKTYSKQADSVEVVIQEESKNNTKVAEKENIDTVIEI
jgi:small subunit ribosomal protein S3